MPPVLRILLLFALLGRGPAVSLFDLANDRGESRDLAGEEPQRAAQLREKLHRWRAEVQAQEMTVRGGAAP